MPRFNYHAMIETVMEHGRDDLFILQIGANDGQTHDPLHKMIQNNPGWSAILVEPLPFYYEQLKARYAGRTNIRLVNSAITDQNGPVEMHYIPHDTIQQADLPRWATGAASLYKDRNALGHAEYERYVETIEVKGQTLKDLIQSEGIGRIDILQTDAEGYDYHIINQLDFNRFHPLIIYSEVVNLPANEETALRNILDREGYLHSKTGYDRLAIDPKQIYGGLG